MLIVEGTSVRAETATISARFERGALTRLVSKLDDREPVRCDAPQSALQLVCAGEAATDVAGRLASNVTAHALSPTRAEVWHHYWDADGAIEISEDVASGDLIVEPSAYSSRPGGLVVSLAHARRHRAY